MGRMRGGTTVAVDDLKGEKFKEKFFRRLKDMLLDRIVVRQRAKR